MELTSSLFVVVLVIAFLCQYLSISFGMGYGTTITPLLLIMGLSPLQVVPAVLSSQLAGGIVGGLAHYRAGNIELDFRRDNRLVKERLRGLGYLPKSDDAKVIFTLAAFGVMGVLVGVLAAVNIPSIVLEAYIGAMVLGMGLTILLWRSHKGAFSWRGLVALGLLSAFNKGMSGGGYVPLVTGGQIIGGREAKSSVGNTTVAVAIVCAVGFLSYLLIEGDIFWILVVAMSIGSVIAAPLAVLTVSRTKAANLRFAIGLATVILGTLTLVKTFIW